MKTAIFSLMIAALSCSCSGNSNKTKDVNNTTTEVDSTTIQKYEVDEFTTDNGKSVSITFIKHGTLMLDVDGTTIHIDRVTMFCQDYNTLPKADIVLVSHEHGDHLDSLAIAQISTEKTVFLSNGHSAELTGKSQPLAIGESYTFAKGENNITIYGTAAYNCSEGRTQFHPKGRDLGFIVEYDGLRIYIAGDTEDIPEMKELKDIDIAFLPVNQPYTMTPEQCINAINMFEPKIVYPYHYGQTDLSPIVNSFKDNAKIEVRIRQMQ